MSIQTLLGDTPPALVTCQPSDELRSAVSAMVGNGLNAVAIVDTDGQLAGILTDHDVMRAVHEHGGSLTGATVAAWMTPEVITCPIETKLTNALKIMGRHGIRHLVVTEHRTPLAVVGIRQILGKIHEHDELEINVLRDIAVAVRAGVAA